MDELDYNYLAELVLKTQRGDSEAFAELYTATYQKQYRFAYRYAKDAYLAQDILQDVYILVLKNINALKNPRLFVSWLNQITFRTCFDVCQKHSRHEEELNHVTEMTQTKDLQPDSMTHNPEKQLMDHFDQTMLMASVLELQPQHAQALIMRYFNDMSIDEIADAMNCSHSTIKRRLVKGKKLLEKLLKNKIGGDWFE